LNNDYADVNSNYSVVPPSPIQMPQREYCNFPLPFNNIINRPQQLPPSKYANMTKHTLHALSAAPKPKLTHDWVQHRRSEQFNDVYQNLNRSRDPCLRQTSVSRNSDTWVQNQQKRRSDPQGDNYKNHWLIQEAEQRRLDQQRGVKNAHRKPLPDSVIQTITQRVQSLKLGERRRPMELPLPSLSVSNRDLTQVNKEQERVLSVSGKKKCSHCCNELGKSAHFHQFT